jgi:hypothetical protein
MTLVKPFLLVKRKGLIQIGTGMGGSHVSLESFQMFAEMTTESPEPA